MTLPAGYFELADGPMEDDPVLHPKQKKMPPHCYCGRFAKWVGDQHYYNGRFDCYRYTVRCTRCGDIDVECV
jgi:hypothetical protein